LKDKVAAEIIDRVAKVLMETPSYRELLKGDPGDDAEPPTLDDVVKAILETDPEAIHSKVAQGIWLANSEKLVEHRRLIANVAQAVYERYGKELRGADGANGQSPDPKQIAEMVASDLRFADIVSQLLQRR